MRIGRFTVVQKFEIWSPRWHDMWVNGEKKKSPVILLNKHKVGFHNEIVFTKTKAERFKGSWYITGEHAKQFNIGSNGVIECYEIPFDALEPLERV